MLRALFLLLFATTVTAQQPSDSTPPPCAAPEASQFDFWLGQWDLTWADSGQGTNHITKPLGNCVIQEQFRDLAPNGFAGMSVSVYDPQAKLWRQTWVDNSGGYMVFTGGWANDRMTLSRTITKRDGTEVIQRMVFHDIAADSFVWDWQASTDNGATWEMKWQIFYKRAE